MHIACHHAAQAQAHANQVAAAELHRSKLQAELAKRPEAKAFQELKSRCAAMGFVCSHNHTHAVPMGGVRVTSCLDVIVRFV